MGLEVARSVLETGGDVICMDRQTEPLLSNWGTFLQPSKSMSCRLSIFMARNRDLF